MADFVLAFPVYALLDKWSALLHNAVVDRIRKIYTLLVSRNALIMLLWTVGGIFSWLSSAYLFSKVLSPHVDPALVVSNESIASSVRGYLAIFGIMHGAEYIMALLFSIGLSVLTGRRKLWIAGFVFGAAGYTVYMNFDSLIFYLGYYEKLPSWALLAWTQSMISSLIILPLLVWLGATLGNRIYQRRTAFPGGNDQDR